MPVIIAIVGPSGSGKDVLSRFLNECGVSAIRSYTTRPMRPGEDKSAHYFVSEEDKPKECDMMAYTKFGGYEYWTTKSQLVGVKSYAIDENGLRYLRNRLNGMATIKSVYIERDIELRKASGVDENRYKRDEERNTIPIEEYDFHYINDKSLDDLRQYAIQLNNTIRWQLQK